MRFIIKLRAQDGTLGSITKEAGTLEEALRIYEEYVPVLGWEKAGYSWGF